MRLIELVQRNCNRFSDIRKG